jgi:glycosyltransferase involved in cell wall biosynthesis
MNVSGLQFSAEAMSKTDTVREFSAKETSATGLCGSAATDLSAIIVDPSNYSLAYDRGLCAALAQQGCKVALARSEDINGGDGEFDAPFEVWKSFYPRTHAYAKTHSRGRIWRTAKAGEHVLSMRRLAARVERTKPSVVHFQWLPLPFLDQMFFARLRSVAPLVLTLHNTSVFHGESAYRLYGLGLQSAFKRFDAVIVHAEYSKRKAIEQEWISEERVHVIPHGVMSHYRDFAGHGSYVHPASEAEPVVLFFGNLKQYKGVDLLIRAFAQLTSGVRQKAKLHIVGSPAMDVNPLRELAKQLGISDRIRWDLRFIPEDEVQTVFASASVVVLPYREIDQSGVLLTAIALERAVVATQIGAISETIRDGVHGFIVPPEQPEPMARAIEKILTDTCVRQSMEAAMRNLSEDLSWDSIARKTATLYRSVAGLGK